MRLSTSFDLNISYSKFFFSQRTFSRRLATNRCNIVAGKNLTAVSSVENLSSRLNKFEDAKFNERPRFL